MEDEELLNNKPVDPRENPSDSIFGALDHLGLKRKSRADLKRNSKIYEQSTFGKSQYDKQLAPNRNIDLTNIQETLEAYRSRQQPQLDKFGNSVGRLVNIIPEAIGGMAAVLDFEDYLNQDDEVGNWLTNYMNSIKEDVNESLPIYRENRGQALDVGDPSWWWENGSSLVNSIAGFAITGGAVSKGLQGLSKIAKINQLGSTISGAVEVGGTALALNQAEGILEATEVYNEIYNFQIDKLTKEGHPSDKIETLAKKRAADAASVAVNTNRLNILLNLSSASLFLKSNTGIRNIISKPTSIKSLGTGFLEGSQESAEEVINFIASQRGKAVGKDKDYTIKDVIKDITSPQAAEAAFLGFLGGLGQTIITTEGVNRIKKTTDPETGQKMSIKAYNNYVYNKQKAVLDDYNPEKFNDIYTSFQNQKILEDKLAKELANGNLEKADTIKELILDNQAYTAFKNGTTEVFEQYFKDIQSNPQKEGYVDNYKEVAQNAINKIRKLEDIFKKTNNFSNGKELYFNRALLLHYEDHHDRLESEVIEIENEVLKKANRVLGSKTDSKGYTTVEQRSEPLTNIENVPSSVKKYPLYKEYKQKKNELNKIKDYIVGIETDFVNLFTEERAKEYKKEEEKQTSNIQDIIDTEAEILQEESNKQEKEKVKQDIIDQQKSKEPIIKQNKEDKQDSKDLLKIKALQKRVGEKMILPLDDNKSVEATIHSVSDSVITLIDQNNNEYAIPLDPSLIPDEMIEPEVETPELGLEKETKPVKQEDSIQLEDNVTDDSGSKIIAVDENGAPFSFVSKEWMDFQLNPIDKKNTKVNFKINFVEPNIRKEWDNALKGYNSLLEGNKLDETQKQFLIDHLPINVVVSEGVEAPLSTQPRTEGGINNFNKYDRLLRTNIINSLINGESIENISGEIKDQKSGLLIEDFKENGIPENSVLELDYINNDISKVNLYMVNDTGDLQSPTGENIIFNKPSGKGEIYLKVKRANGKDFNLKLNIKKVNEIEADILYQLYEFRLRDKLKDSFLIKDLDGNLVSQIKNNLKEELKVIKKPFNDLTIKDITDFLIWDGSKSAKSRINITGGLLKFGPYNVTANGLDENVKSNFIDWITNNKRRHIRFKKKSNDSAEALDIQDLNYLKYLLENRILNTNAITGAPLFQGDTSIYLKNSININEIQEEEASSVNIFDKLINKTEKKPEKIRNFDKNFVPLQEVENIETTEQKESNKEKKKRKTNSQRKADAKAAKDRINKKC